MPPVSHKTIHEVESLPAGLTRLIVLLFPLTLGDLEKLGEDAATVDGPGPANATIVYCSLTL